MDSTEYSSLEEFLKNYDSSVFEKLSMTVDILIMSVSSEDVSNYRKLDEKKFSVLLVKRNTYPFKDKWCLPGGFVNIDESLDDAARRVLRDETNLKDIYLEQLYTFGNPKRDPRMRIVSTSYMALIDKNSLNEELTQNASWFNLSFYETKDKIDVLLDNGSEEISFSLDKVLREKTTNRYDYVICKNDSIAFDHPVVIASGVSRLKNKIEYTDIVFNMMPEYFTLGELQKVYEVILGKKLLAPAFRRIIAGKVVKTDLQRKGEGHRPSVLYKYNG